MIVLRPEHQKFQAETSRKKYKQFPLRYKTADAYAQSLVILFNQYEKKAADTGISFNLTSEEFLKLISAKCSYCGCKPKLPLQGKRKRSDIDLIVRWESYSMGNVVSSCRGCKTLRGSLNITQLERLSKIYRRLARHPSRKLTVASACQKSASHPKKR